MGMVLFFSIPNNQPFDAFFSMESPAWHDSAYPVRTPFGVCDCSSQKHGDIWAAAVCRQEGIEGGIQIRITVKQPSDMECISEKRIWILCSGKHNEVKLLETAPGLSTVGLDKTLNKFKSK